MNSSSDKKEDLAARSCSDRRFFKALSSPLSHFDSVLLYPHIDILTVALFFVHPSFALFASFVDQFSASRRTAFVKVERRKKENSRPSLTAAGTSMGRSLMPKRE